MTPAPSRAAETRLDLALLLRRLQRLSERADHLMHQPIRHNHNRDR